MSRYFTFFAIVFCAWIQGMHAHALPESGPEEIFGYSTFITEDGRKIHFFIVRPNSADLSGENWRFNRQYTKDLILGAGDWYVKRLKTEHPDLGNAFFEKVSQPGAWLDGRSAYVIAMEQEVKRMVYRSMIRFSWRSGEHPLTPSEESFSGLTDRLKSVPNIQDYKVETSLWQDLMKDVPNWQDQFVLNAAPFVNPGVQGGEWIEIKNLIVAQGERIDFIPMLLFVMERSGAGYSLFSDKPMDFNNWELKVQDRYFFTAPQRLVPYYKYHLAFEMGPEIHPGVWLFTSNRKNYIQQLRTKIRARKGVGQLINGRWDTPGFLKSDNWRGLTYYENQDAYLKYLPRLTNGCDGLWTQQKKIQSRK